MSVNGDSSFRSFLLSCQSEGSSSTTRKSRKRSAFPTVQVQSTVTQKVHSMSIDRKTSYLLNIEGLDRLYDSLGEGFFRYLWMSTVVLFPLAPKQWLVLGCRTRMWPPIATVRLAGQRKHDQNLRLRVKKRLFFLRGKRDEVRGRRIG